jgi:small subunit ribosomal protein S17
LRARELRDLTDEELEEKMGETRKELFNLRFQSATGALENSARLRSAKREIARICREDDVNDWGRRMADKEQKAPVVEEPGAVAEASVLARSTAGGIEERAFTRGAWPRSGQAESEQPRNRPPIPVAEKRRGVPAADHALGRARSRERQAVGAEGSSSAAGRPSRRLLPGVVEESWSSPEASVAGGAWSRRPQLLPRARSGGCCQHPYAPAGPSESATLAPPSDRPTRVKATEQADRPAPKPARIGRRQERQGLVVSDAMEKTIVVKVELVKAHPKYKKVVRRSVKFHAHDERGEAKVGDVVRIVETRPLSKTKHWRLAEIVEAAK